jgi:hypothetical protein
MSDERSPMGLPAFMTGTTVTVDGERYVSLRHVHALFEHTAEGQSFYRRRQRLSWRRAGGLVIGDELGEERPQALLEREFGNL